MFTAGIYSEIDRVTKEALEQIPGQEVVERVTVVRGYEQLSALYPNRPEYADKLAKALLDLTTVAERTTNSGLTGHLQTICANMARQRLSETNC